LKAKHIKLLILDRIMRETVDPDSKKTRISVIGAGHVGLCTAVAFAYKGYRVTVTESARKKVADVNRGTVPFYEPDLSNLLQKAVQNGQLRCLCGHTEEAVLETDVTFCAVGTPIKRDGSADLRFVAEAANAIGRALRMKREYQLVVVKSTVPPMTTENLVKPILEKESGKRCGSSFGLCMNPEFLREGFALNDLLHADRLVIGEHDTKSGEKLVELYEGFYGEVKVPTIRTTLSTAEMTKYASNCFLATKISYINFVAGICEKIRGVDVEVVAGAMRLDNRIGPGFLNAGLGYGGSCFSKDTKALIAYAKRLGCNTKLLESVENVNSYQLAKVIQTCEEQLGGLKGKTIAILGLSFKPETDDMRDARSTPLVNELARRGAKVVAYDPIASPVAKKIFKASVGYATSAIDCLKNADCCIVVTEWNEFRRLEPKDFKNNMKSPLLIDGRRIYDPSRFRKELDFIAIGLATETE
jgi:UDPglucose 6-dehydrogenase